MRRTKILVTLGPATDSTDMLEKLLSSGMNVARCNFSHGDHKEHLDRVTMLREVAARRDQNVAVLMDTKGPEIRTGEVENGEIDLVENTEIVVTTEPCTGTSEKISVSYKKLPDIVRVGTIILLDDGLITLEVIKVIDKKNIRCVVLNNGSIKGRRGVNIPNFMIDLPNPTETDRKDVVFAVENDFDFIAVSFVQNAATILEYKKILNKNGGSDIKVIAKIENHEGLRNFDSILNVADGIMVARGDLGVELPFEEVPIVQKELIKKSFMAGKPVITATQLLHSMIDNPRPTRAEVSDIANAIYDLTSAIMLSGETSIGEYPDKCVRVMSTVADRTERAIDYRSVYVGLLSSFDRNHDVTNAVTNAALTTAYEVGAKAIITVTETGYTARMLSKMRPKMPIIAITTEEKVRRQLAINWGVYPVMGHEYSTLDELHTEAVRLCLEGGFVENGDIVVIVAGVPVGRAGATNLIKVEIVGDVIVKGTTVHKGKVTGNVCLANSPEELLLNFRKNDIVVLRYIDDSTLPVLKEASGLIIENSEDDTRVDIIAKTLDIPVIRNARAAYDVLKNGTMVTLDADSGCVSKI